MLSTVLFALVAAAQPAPLPRASGPGLDPAAVEALLSEAKKQKTDTLLVVQHGEVVLEHYAEGYDARRPVYAMSVTKSVAGLAVGLCMADGKIDSLDAPLARWLPAFDTDDRRGITVRHVLTQSTGLLSLQGAKEVYAQSDRSGYAQQLAVVAPPGTKFAYNNAASQLLEPLVKAACGERIDLYLETRLFQPLGITNATWTFDEAGNPSTFADLKISAEGLARLGLLLLHHGRHGEQQLLPAAFVDEAGKSQRPNPGYGLMWWLDNDGGQFVQPPAHLAQLTATGLPGASRLVTLSGRPFKRSGTYWMEVGARLSKREREQMAQWLDEHDSPLVWQPNVTAIRADGWLGQYIIVVPELDLVVVRQRASSEGNDNEENVAYGFRALPTLVKALFTSTTAPAQAR